MATQHKRAARRNRNDVVRLIVTTRERFPHTPRLTSAMRRLIWRYAAQAQQADRAAAKRRQRRTSTPA
ncbi:MAG: hypothetical protein HXY24_15185 [Rubrivivax sp.]|nr:hypothetical protein [Rubrivivax sp.]